MDDPLGREIIERLDRIEVLAYPDAPMFPFDGHFPFVAGRQSQAPLFGLANTSYDFMIWAVVLDENRLEIRIRTPDGQLSRPRQFVVFDRPHGRD